MPSRNDRTPLTGADIFDVTFVTLFRYGDCRAREHRSSIVWFSSVDHNANALNGRVAFYF